MAPVPTRRTLFFFLLLALSAVSSSLAVAVTSSLVEGDVDGNVSGDVDYSCVYTVFVRTGSAWKGGTDSVVGVEFAGADGRGVRIDDLERWGGLMGPRHDYYERGNLDLFSGRGPCLPSSSGPPCWMNLTSDGSGARHGWYCSSVEVTVTRPGRGCAQRLFEVGQWLATDTSPYRLTAVRDQCRGTYMAMELL